MNARKSPAAIGAGPSEYPALFAGGLRLFLMRQMQRRHKPLSFGKSRARLFSAQQKKALQGCGRQRRSQEELQEL